MLGLVKTIYKKDPAIKKGVNALEILFYQGLHVILLHRIASFLYKIKIPIIPRLISQISRFLTGVEIHPGAKIGKIVFIDHGMGVVVGETAVIGNDVVMYDNVILGARGWNVNKNGEKRHPIIGDNVTLCSGCKILGPIHIGNNCVIGAGAIITKDIRGDRIVTQEKNLCIKEIIK